MAAHVDADAVCQAVKLLRNVAKKYESAESKKVLLEDDSRNENVYLQFTLKKIPFNKNAQRIKIPLPHALVTDAAEVCLFVGDLDRKDRRAENEKTVDHFTEMLKDAGVTRNIDIIPLRQLRTEYQPYEAKRNLCAGYDVFLADQVIYPILPRLLGKTFFAKNKLPRKVDLKRKNLQTHVEHVLSESSLMIRGEGSASALLVAHLGQTDADATENVLAACDALERRLPGGWDNVLSLHLKTHKSVAVPLYMSFGSRNDVALEKNAEKCEMDEDDLSTVPGGKVSVSPFGDVLLKRNAEDDDDDEEERKMFRAMINHQSREVTSEALKMKGKGNCRTALLKTAFANRSGYRGAKKGPLPKMGDRTKKSPKKGTVSPKKTAVAQKRTVRDSRAQGAVFVVEQKSSKNRAMKKGSSLKKWKVKTMK